MFRPELSRACAVWTIILMCASAPLIAQCNPGGGPGGVGVDLIVGDIPAGASFGEAGGFYGFSVGASLCNIGTAPAPWTSNTADHPVILQNLYRLRDGRFEQIGASWMRHLLVPLTQDGCGCGCVPAGFSALGAGCSDTTSAAVNGSPTQLSAPSELLDASFGSFVFPPVLDPTVTDATSRRIRVAASDLDPTLNVGAQYFAEVMLYAESDATAGNGSNPASVRPVQFGPTANNYPLQFTGPTERQKSALEVWADLDPTVFIVTLADGTGGSFLFATKVTDLGTGQWSYEYALSNLSSGRGADKLSVTVGPQVVTAIGFHDCDPHSGDVFGGTDWVSTVASGVLTWETTNATTNPLANALRAGKTFNYRLVADAAPVASNLAISMFQTGSPSEIIFEGLAPAATFIDCNGNGMADFIDIQSAESLDCDGNGVPDECDDPIYIRGDANLDLTLDVADPITILGQLFSGTSVPCESAADGNGDHARDIADAIYVLNHLFANGAPPPAPYPTCDTAAAGSPLGCCVSPCSGP